MRFRSTTTGGFTTQEDWINYNTNGTVQSHLYSYSGTREVKSINDTEVANFKKLLACGKFLPLNAVVIEKDVIECIPGSGSYYNHLGTKMQDGSWTAGQSFHFDEPLPDQSLIDAVVLSAMSNAASEKWDFLTFLAEYQKSVKTVQSAASSFILLSQQLANTVRARRMGGYLKDGVTLFKRAKQDPWDLFRELWLGARYAVRPMVYDALDAMNALTHLLNGDATFVKGTGHQISAVNDFYDSGWTIRTSKTEERYIETLSGSLTYRGCSFMALESGLNGAIQVNPLTTAWELTPWSFVFDWFMNIGGLLNTITPYLKGDFAGTMYSLKYELEWASTYSHRPRAVSQPYTGGFGPNIRSRRLTRYIREETPGLPLPPFNPRLTLPKIVDLVALLVRGKRKINDTLSYRR